MSLTFVHETLPQRVLFGTGMAAAHLAAEAGRLAARRPMLIASSSARQAAERMTAGLPIAVTAREVAPHVPAALAAEARTAATEHDVDLLISVGGGSATGLAKAVALTSGVPIIAVPTTFSGSEATDTWGITDAGRKQTGTDPRVLPAAIVYDAQLVQTMPTPLAVSSALNALAHCVDSLWGPRADPINQALALEGARSLAGALRGMAADSEELGPRERALYGCYLGAAAFASAGAGLHHKICHVLGGTFNLPHAQTHATVLPYVLALNGPGAPEAAGRLAAALAPEPALASGGDTDPAASALSALLSLTREVSAPRSLAEAGFTADGIPETVAQVLAAVPAGNPVPVTGENLTRLLEAALAGDLTAPPQPGA